MAITTPSGPREQIHCCPYWSQAWNALKSFGAVSIGCHSITSLHPPVLQSRPLMRSASHCAKPLPFCAAFAGSHAVPRLASRRSKGCKASCRPCRREQPRRTERRLFVRCYALGSPNGSALSMPMTKSNGDLQESGSLAHDTAWLMSSRRRRRSLPTSPALRRLVISSRMRAISSSH